MACHWQNVPGVGMVHFNMATPRKRRCAHCDCPDAKALCDWPMVVPKRIKSVDELDVGDVITQSHGWRARILSLTIGPMTERHWGRRGMLGYALVLDRGSGHPVIDARLVIQIVLDEWLVDRLRVERLGTCDKPCCFRCRRHVGPDRDYCRDHWHLQAPDAAEPTLRPPAAIGARVRGGRAADRLRQRRLFE